MAGERVAFACRGRPWYLSRSMADAPKTSALRGLPEGGDPLSAMTPRFNLLFRGFAHRYFRHFDLDPQALATLQ